MPGHVRGQGAVDWLALLPASVAGLCSVTETFPCFVSTRGACPSPTGVATADGH